MKKYTITLELTAQEIQKVLELLEKSEDQTTSVKATLDLKTLDLNRYRALVSLFKYKTFNTRRILGQFTSKHKKDITLQEISAAVQLPFKTVVKWMQRNAKILIDEGVIVRLDVNKYQVVGY